MVWSAGALGMCLMAVLVSYSAPWMPGYATRGYREEREKEMERTFCHFPKYTSKFISYSLDKHLLNIYYKAGGEAGARVTRTSRGRIVAPVGLTFL